MDEVKAVITLRNGKKVEQPMPKPLNEAKEGQDEEPEMIVIKEEIDEEEHASTISLSTKRQNMGEQPN